MISYLETHKLLPETETKHTGWQNFSQFAVLEQKL